jgi:hypothetical protein
MKLCQLCGQEQEQVSTLAVAPATWNGFNHFASVCAACQASTKNRTRLRPASKGTVVKQDAAAAAAAPGSTTISHRRTGATLQVVEGPLARAELTGAALNGAHLAGANMPGAILKKADLRLSDLTGADLRGADLRGADLRGADLRSTDLREARLDRANLQSTRCDGMTNWPEGFDPRSAGAVIE